jgi:hypothetical protein
MLFSRSLMGCSARSSRKCQDEIEQSSCRPPVDLGSADRFRLSCKRELPRIAFFLISRHLFASLQYLHPSISGQGRRYLALLSRINLAFRQSTEQVVLHVHVRLCELRGLKRNRRDGRWAVCSGGSKSSQLLLSACTGNVGGSSETD